MKKQKLRNILATGILTAGLFAGCETHTGTGTLIGTTIGAGVGQVIGRDTESTLIGAAIGAGAGYWLGSRADQQRKTNVDKAYRELMGLNDEAMIRREIALFGDREFGNRDYSPSPDEEYKAYRAFRERWSYEQYREGLRDRPFVRVIESYRSY